MWKKLDLYILKKLLGTFFVSIGIIMAIVIVIDYSEKIDDFTDSNAPFSAVVMYYVLLIPYYVNLFSALFCFVSVLLVSSKLGSNTEIVAMLSCGISFRRILVPFMVNAFIVATISTISGLYILPNTNSMKLEYEAEYIGTSKTRFIDNTSKYHAQISKREFIYIRYYNRDKDIAKDFSLEKLDSNKRLIAKLNADKAVWNSGKQKWDLFNWRSRSFNDDGSEVVLQGAKMDTTINLHPKDFKQRKGTIETMDYDELNQFIDKEILAGSSNINSYLIEKYKRFSFPFSTFVLTLIAASLASRKIRGGLGMHIAFGMLLAFSYILFMQLSSEFSIKGGFDPLLACWFPNIIYMVIGGILYRYAPK